jgi:glycosyltransferase involved in cell wall biosynthesis
MRLNIFSPINSLGYGIVGKNIVMSLSRKDGVDITLTPVYGDIKVETHEEGQLIGQAFNAGQSMNLSDPALLIWHAQEMQIFTGNPRIGMPIFELTEFNAREKNFLKQLDYVAAMSQWGKEVIVNNGVQPEEKVFVFPGGVDLMRFNPYIEKSVAHKSDRVTLLSGGKFEVRKGHSLLLKAFVKAFENRKDLDVRLIAHWGNPFMQDLRQLFVNSMSKLRFNFVSGNAFRRDNMVIELIERVPSQDDLASIYACADIGVFPSSAEGWNLPLCEMMAMGKPCIATNYSAHTEYINEDNAILLEHFKMEKAFEERWFPHGIGEWAIVDEDELISHMIYSVENVAELKETVGKNAAGHIADNFTWSHTANKITKVLEKL